MRRTKKKGNLRLAFTFSSVVFALILISLLFRVIMIIKDSHFDGSNRFTIGIFQKNKTQIISFDPKTRSISILNLKESIPQQNARRLLEIPIDANIKSDHSIGSQHIAVDLLKLGYNPNLRRTQLTVLDFSRLIIFAKRVHPGYVFEKTASLKNNTSDVSSFISSYFIDKTIQEEKTSIQIINAAGVYGLANRLADFITNMGGNVVLVSTDNNLQDASEILYSGRQNYTIKRLSTALGFKTRQVKKKEIVDVTIIIGKDSAKGERF